MKQNRLYLLCVPCPMFYEKEKVAKKHQEVYSFRKGSDSPGEFKFKETERTDTRAVSRNLKTEA